MSPKVRLPRRKKEIKKRPKLFDTLDEYLDHEKFGYCKECLKEGLKPRIKKIWSFLDKYHSVMCENGHMWIVVFDKDENKK